MKYEEMKLFNTKIVNERFTLEGSPSIPAGQESAAAILQVYPTASITEASFTANGAALSGNAVFQIIYADKDGGISSFDAQCTFTRQLEGEFCEDVRPFYAVFPISAYAKAEGGAIELKCELLITLAWSCPQVIRGVTQEEGAVIKNKSVTTCRIADACLARTVLNGSITVPQSMPEVKKVLAAKACCSITRVHEDAKASSIEGEVRLDVVYLSRDKSSPLQTFCESLPFSEVLSVGGKPVVAALPVQVYAEMSAEESDTINYNIIITSSAMTMEQGQLELPVDAYTVGHACKTEAMQVDIGKVSAITPQKRMVRTSVTLPKIYPEAARVLLENAGVDITETKKTPGGTEVIGELVLDLCYSTTLPSVTSARLRLPFSVKLEGEGGEGAIMARCEYAAAEGSGRELELRALISFCGITAQQEQADIVTDIVKEEALPHEPCISLYFADEGEDEWTVAKQFAAAGERVTPAGDNAFIVIH